MAERDGTGRMPDRDLAAALAAAPEMTLTGALAYLGIRLTGRLALNRALPKVSGHLQGTRNSNLGKALGGVNRTLTASATMCYRGCPPQDPAPVTTEIYDSGLYLVCKHSPRHAVKLRV